MMWRKHSCWPRRDPSRRLVSGMPRPGPPSPYAAQHDTAAGISFSISRAPLAAARLRLEENSSWADETETYGSAVPRRASGPLSAAEY